MQMKIEKENVQEKVVQRDTEDSASMENSTDIKKIVNSDIKILGTPMHHPFLRLTSSQEMSSLCETILWA